MSIDNLIKLAKSQPIPTEDTNLNEAERFCHAFGVKQGVWHIRAEYIYNLYKEWAITPLTKRQFFRQFAILLISTKKDNRVVYKLNQSFYELGEKCKKLKKQE